MCLHDNLQALSFTIAAINTLIEARVMLLCHILYVLAVAEHRNFTRATETLHVSRRRRPSRSGSLKKPSGSYSIAVAAPSRVDDHAGATLDSLDGSIAVVVERDLRDEFRIVVGEKSIVEGEVGRAFFRDDRPSPLDFLARLASLVPRPRINLTRFHGCFAPNHRLRAQIVPAKRGRGAGQHHAAGEGEKASPDDRLLPVRR